MSQPQTIDLEFWRTAPEAQMRDADAPWPRTREQLDELLDVLREREHDYGTCVYAMSVAAQAAFNLIAHNLGVTGFQASCADGDFLRRTRRLKHGFRIVNYEDLLYPQNSDKLRLSPESMLEDDDLRRVIVKEARDLLQKERWREWPSHPNVVAHWQKLAAMEVRP